MLLGLIVLMYCDWFNYSFRTITQINNREHYPTKWGRMCYSMKTLSNLMVQWRREQSDAETNRGSWKFQRFTSACGQYLDNAGTREELYKTIFNATDCLHIFYKVEIGSIMYSTMPMLPLYNSWRLCMPMVNPHRWFHLFCLIRLLLSTVLTVQTVQLRESKMKEALVS